MKASDLISQLIPHLDYQKAGQGKAPVNIALAKYWGKRNVELNLPVNSSLSISLPDLGTSTQLELIEHSQDTITLNGQALSPDKPFCHRLSRYLDKFRPDATFGFTVNTVNTVPTAAGLASSASGYAALVLALNDAFQWQLDTKSLSILARLGSGSASRSIFKGFSIWHKGETETGLDSFAEPVPTLWPEFCIGLLEVDTEEKAIGSTAGMQRTVEQCDLYQSWPKKAEKDVATIADAIYNKAFTVLGETAENNALSMHATMIATWPPILYWQPESITFMHQVWELRRQGIEVYFTMDAGPNLKLIFLSKDIPAITAAFDSIQIMKPFEEE